ncbi:MAG: PstS family phosphate ABC transporter substrate-binding protein [Candidatus Edwardsbacteria bacterium]
MWKRKIFWLTIIHTCIFSLIAFNLRCRQRESKGGPGQQILESETATAGYIVVQGSDTASPMMLRAAEVFMDLYSKAKILVLGSGSKAGIAALNEGKARIAVMSRQLNSQEKKILTLNGIEIEEFKIALDGVAVIVNPTNTMERLTLPQIAKIFKGEIRNWQSLGGLNLPIIVVTRASNSGTYEYFQNEVLAGHKYSVKAYPCTTTIQVIEMVGKYKGAIGYIGMNRLYRSWEPWPPQPDERIKTLSVAKDAKSDFIYPDQETVDNKTYPLIREIYLYTNKNEENKHERGLSSLANGFVSFLMHSQGQKVVAAYGFVPVTVPVKIRK